MYRKNGERRMENTCFASPERSGPEELELELALASSNPVIDGVLKTVGGLLAVLNSKRQVVVVNDYFLRRLGIDSTDRAFGLRLGEVVGCVHAGDEPAGCGTTKYCSSCGAAIAMVTSLESNKPVERRCAIEIRHGNQKSDIYLNVRAVPLDCEDERFLLVFLQDITRQQQWACEERVFFHDLKNVLFGLHGIADLLTMGSPEMARQCGRLIRKLVRRLNSEIEMQKTLSLSEEHTYTPSLEDVSVSGVYLEIQEEFANNPVARDKNFSITSGSTPMYLRTDTCVLFRVLINMIINAFEATEPGGEVRLGAEMVGEDRIRFTVWNRRVIPEEEQLRIFQRNFSTKTGEGRGLGTWSMKFFGEKFLGGQVGFTSSEPEGTLFFLLLPQRMAAA